MLGDSGKVRTENIFPVNSSDQSSVTKGSNEKQ